MARCLWFGRLSKGTDGQVSVVWQAKGTDGQVSVIWQEGTDDQVSVVWQAV